MNRGFTLIELLICIAMGGIILSVVYPLFVNRAVGEVAPRHSDNATAATIVRCQDGIVTKDGDIVVKDGQAVKC